MVVPDSPLPAPTPLVPVSDSRTPAQQYLDHQRVVLQSSSGLEVQVCCITVLFLCSLHSSNVLLPSTPSLSPSLAPKR